VPSGLTATAGNSQVTLNWTPGTTTTYYYEVVAVNSSGTSGGSNDTSAAPTGGPVVTSYNVYRGTGSYQESSTPVATGITSPSYTDSSVTAGTTYYYYVAANSITGTSNGSNQSNPATPTSGGGSAPVITSSTSASGTAGSAFSYQITASNSPTGYNATGLPGGLSVNTGTGGITGTPTASGTTSVIISATNANGTGTATLTLTVSPASPVITSSTSASGTVGTAFSYQITASNSPTSYSATGLPSGLSVNTGTGAITGTPGAGGTSSVTIGATNAGGTGTATLTLTISAAGSPPAITSSTSTSGTVGSAFSYQITANNSPTSYGASGLPSGLSVNTGTGAITGTPTTAGTSSVTISATNAYGTGTATLSLTVSPAGTQTSIAMQFVGSGTALLSTDSAGVSSVAQTNWNVLSGASFTNVALANNAGAGTTATLTGTAGGSYWSGGSSASPAGNSKLASGELVNTWPTSNTLTVANIPYATYDVYVYAGIDATGRNETVGLTPSGGAGQFYSFTTEGGGSAWTVATSTWNGSGTAPSLPSANYVHFTGLTASSFTMNWGAPGNGGLNGIQIVPVP